MTRPSRIEAVHTTEASRVRPRGRRASPSGPPWRLWLLSLFVAAGAILLVTLTGAGGAATDVPSAVQVGRQAATVASSVAASTAPGTKPNASPPPTTSEVAHRTTVVRPLATVTDHEDSSGATAPGTTPTSIPSTSVDH